MQKFNAQVQSYEIFNDVLPSRVCAGRRLVSFYKTPDYLIDGHKWTRNNLLLHTAGTLMGSDRMI